LSGLPIDDGEVHDSFDPYPPANSEAAYWPEKRLEEEMKQLSSNAQNVRSEGTGILGHAWQFVQSIWPQVRQSI
jgi:hypothetical protein